MTGRSSDRVNLPAHYSIDGVCAACRGAIKTADDRYKVGTREYHANCFDISLFGALPHSAAADLRADAVSAGRDVASEC